MLRPLYKLPVPWHDEERGNRDETSVHAAMTRVQARVIDSRIDVVKRILVLARIVLDCRASLKSDHSRSKTQLGYVTRIGLKESVDHAAVV